MTIKLDALIERWPAESLLYIPHLPGLLVRGPDPAALQRAVSDGLKTHLVWLVRHDLIEDPAGEVDLSVVEQLAAPAAGIGPRFAADLPVPGQAEVETALAVGRAAISDAIDAYDLADAGLSADNLRHIAERDGWFATRLGWSEPLRSLADPIDRLVDAAGAFEDAVDAFLASGHPDLWTRDREEWTLAKVLRRRTAHLRDHLPELSPPDPDESE